MIERRTLITGLVALVAAPAIVKAASLMKVAPTERLRVTTPYWEYNPLLDKWTQYSNSVALDQYNVIARSALDQLAQHIEREAVLARDFYAGEQWSTEKVGDVVRIRLPNDYAFKALEFQNPGLLRYNKERRSIDRIPQIPTALGVAALAVAAAPVVEQVLQKPVTRRFWK